MLALIVKWFIFLDCCIVGLIGGFFPYTILHWHPFFCVLIGLACAFICMMLFESVSKIGRLVQIISGGIWGYLIAQAILQKMGNPDMIWTYGISTLSILIFIWVHFEIANAAQQIE